MSFTAEQRQRLAAILEEAAAPILVMAPEESEALVWRRAPRGWTGETTRVKRRRVFSATWTQAMQDAVAEIVNHARPGFFERLLPNGDGSARRWRPADLLWATLAVAFELGNEDSVADYDGAVRRFEEHVLRDHVELTIIGLLTGVAIDETLPPIRISDDFTLRMIDEETYNQVNGGVLAMQPSRGGLELQRISAVITTTTTIPLTDEGNDWAAQERIERAIQRCVRSLRVVRPGCVDLVGILKTSQGGLAPNMRSLSLPMAAPSTGPAYKISADDVPSLESDLRAVSVALHPVLDFAAERLSDATGRRSSRDRLVDAVVGLEAILLTGTEKHSELGYRFSMNYAAFGSNLEEREARFEKAREVYAGRSAAVHGNTRKFRDGMADEALGMLREVIRHFLGNGTRPDFLEKDYWRRRVLGWIP